VIRRGTDVKIVVIGGSGLIGSKVVKRLTDKGHEVLAASPSSGVNTLTGEGLNDALTGVQVVVDVANSPSFEDAAVMEFFRTSGRNLLSAETAAGVGHHVAVSIVGAERLPDSGYLRAKIAQEELIKHATVPYTIIRSTQFFEFIKAVAETSADGDTIRLTPARLQPIAADDLAAAVADIALGKPVNGTVELAGPEALPLDEMARRVLATDRDSRTVTSDPKARYFDAELDDHSLTPGDDARLGSTHFEEWLAARAAQR
jgi:uncharacterized protein YbjT (DUF2867 family)